MPIHKRSFKCFGALLDDLSQKMPLPFGVRTITTPRGTHAIQSLEQLQDGACYLCSDRHYVKPIDMEVAGKRPAVWHHSYPLNPRRKPSRPDEPPTEYSAHHYYRQPKKIVLVKNSDPAVRRSIILNRKRARSLRVFMDEISELMQCHVRKLYTLEGRKIDSTQSLMQCPSVLVCVGREPFKPQLLENLRKNSEEKLPGIGARSHSSIYSEGHDSKKNVNFGLEAKKSVIHPRSDSSNKSTRFSLSSGKSYANGSGMTSGQPGCVTKEVVMKDDVEKRVLINKDGSLSVEMKVRFRLVNDETLQWSTEIKKLPTSTNECNPLEETDPHSHCLQNKAVYSEPESNAECGAEEACSSKCHQMDCMESYCQNCCNHSQGYDIWKNPLHKDNGTCGTRSCSNSAESSDKIMHQKASVDSVYTVSRSSEEYTEHVVETSCFQQTIEERDTRINYCSTSHCCSQSEVSTSTTKCNIPIDNCKSNTKRICQHNGHTKTDNAQSDHLYKAKNVKEHLNSSTCNSFIIESFIKKKDDDYDDLSPSISRASQQCSKQYKQFACVHCYGRQQSQNVQSSFIPPKASSCTADALKSKSMYATPELNQGVHADTNSMDCAMSSVSNVSSMFQCCCSQCREAASSILESDLQRGLKKEGQNSMSDESNVSNKFQSRTNSAWKVTSDNGAQKAYKEKKNSGNRSVMSTNTCSSVKSTVCPCCGGCGRLISTLPSNIQDKLVQEAEEVGEVKPSCQRSSTGSERSNKCRHCAPQSESAMSNILENTEHDQNNIAEVVVRHACSQRALFDLSDHFTDSEQCIKSNQHVCERSSIAEVISENAGLDDVEGRTESDMTMKSIVNAKTISDILDKLTASETENQIAEEIGHLYIAQENKIKAENVMQDFDISTKERIPSVMSLKTHSSKDSDKSHKSSIQDTETASPPVTARSITCTSHVKTNSERSKIVLCKSDRVTVKSNACSEKDFESVLNPTDMSTGQETTQKTNDAKCSLRNSSPAAPLSPKPPITIENYNQALSVKQINSKTSSKSRCDKCHCSSNRCVEKASNSHLGEFKSPALHGIIDEPLSPTTTTSISLGLGEEQRSEDLNEQSMGNISQIFNEPVCLSEKYTMEPYALDAINNSAITETKERVKTALSTSSMVSDKTKESNFMPVSCKTPEVIFGAISESIISTKLKTESKTESQLLQNDDDQNISIISASSSKSSQNKITFRKDTSHGAATSKDKCTAKSKERSSSNLGIKEARIPDSNSATSVISSKTSKSGKKLTPKNKYVTESQVSQKCTAPDSHGDSVLSPSPDLLKDKDTDAKTSSKRAGSSTSNKNYVLEQLQDRDSNCKCSRGYKQRTICDTSQNKTENHCKESLMPSCLPNASPTDVINDWLKNIPNDGPMYEMEDEFNKELDANPLHISAVEEEGCFRNEFGELSLKPVKVKEYQETGGHESADTGTEDKNTTRNAKLPHMAFQTLADNSDCSHLSQKITNRENVKKNCQSSIQVMKVLLSPKLDRCNSLPEVSPTYGKKLSTSAKGLLDCLANLQMIDPDPKIYDKYSEIISTLQVLWINKPSETMQDNRTMQVCSAEDEVNLRSSSGVDLSSGSIGSGKGSITGRLEKSESAQGRESEIAEQKVFPQIQRAGENINTSIVSSDPITPDIAERVRCSPEHENLIDKVQKDEGIKVTDNVLQTDEQIIDLKDIMGISTGTSENSENIKSGAVADKETNPSEYYNSRTLPSDQKGQLTKIISQDPDPVWVLSLLRKLEKQFMSHYVNAIAEFKVRWDLNDNETLNLMISELKEEVHKRIQCTINRELQKIRSRAGRTPRPPANMLSRDSTVQTEQRRRRLKVMQNKLINASKCEDMNTASGTEFSDQRSEEEYCPCETCVKKKVVSRVVQCAEALSVAPVLKDFDLKTILQTKKHPLVCTPVQSKLDEQKVQKEGYDSSNLQDKNNFEVVYEDNNVDIITKHIGKDYIFIKGETKDEIITEYGIQACENHEGWKTAKDEPVDQEDDGQAANIFYNDTDEADSKTKREKYEIGENLENKSTVKKDNKVMNEDCDEAEEATEGNTTADEELSVEKDSSNEVAAEKKGTQSSGMEKQEENTLKENKSNDERAEEEVSEGETNKEGEFGEDEKEERDATEEKAEIPAESEGTAYRTGEETQSAKEGKISRDE
ncbi:retinitis pigmentosa 1-like 1 protein isoform X1 [Silurus asotus]|uniref:Retinitis pigmentosa 1-like 1 protein isoform X1 n=1 Tax=Silurus asotus TaxID=30991 RepID=A0AAD5ALK0_SILAS|nr:retinitis pigmentosa 1-like 1 protein isoform X1 [Silurus asotus]